MVILINLCIIVSNTHENKALNLSVGGVANQILQLLPSYEKIDNLNIFLVTKYSEYIPQTNKVKKVSIQKFKERKLDEVYFFLKSIFKVVHLHKINHIHAINIHSYYYNMISPLIVRLIFKIPLFIKAPSDFNTHQREEFVFSSQSIFVKLFYYGWMKFFKKIIIRMKDVYIQAINDKIYDDFIKSGISKANIIKLPNGIESKRFLKIEKNIEEQTNFGYIGRLLETKNLRFLLRSFKNYLNYYPNDKLYFFGEGPEKKFIKNFIREHKLTNSIIALGFEKDKSHIYSRINVLIHPTFGEGVPNIILESILTNTFVIASNVSGIKDIIDHKKTGLLFNPFREDDLLKQLLFFKKNSESIELMKNTAKKRILEKYDVDIVTKALYKFLLMRIT
ncbi:MAG: glycosyltransferase [Promethearchaeota archaeon]